jgi:hypothetical protein
VNRESKKPDQGCILTINGGSSSIKFALYQTGKPLKRSLYGKVHRIGLPDTNLAFTDPTENRQDSRRVAAALGGLDTLVFSRRHRRKRARQFAHASAKDSASSASN